MLLIEAIRRRNGLSQEEFAEAAGIDVLLLKDIEDGRVGINDISFMDAWKLARYTAVDHEINEKQIVRDSYFIVDRLFNPNR